MSAAKTLQRRWKEEVTGIRLRHGEDQKSGGVSAARATRSSRGATRSRLRGMPSAPSARKNGPRRSRPRARRAQKKEKHAARFAEMARKRPPPRPRPRRMRSRGRAERERCCSTSRSRSTCRPRRRSGQRARAQPRASCRSASARKPPAPLEPEAMVAKWYSMPAAADDGQAARIAAVVERLLRAEAASGAQARSGLVPVARRAVLFARSAKPVPVARRFPPRRDSRS